MNHRSDSTAAVGSDNYRMKSTRMYFPVNEGDVSAMILWRGLAARMRQQASVAIYRIRSREAGLETYHDEQDRTQPVGFPLSHAGKSFVSPLTAHCQGTICVPQKFVHEEGSMVPSAA